ncbi:putative RNA-binding Zn-ribbon protein involved in translation (DUF1610 family) [Comamonas sp. BIGb0152]|uniref:DUF2321 domain-containing protein n=1 Tax=Comamonas sp. BIGb0152 TaxID=2940601 RepID=UPI0021670374|nr:DUF2321 domain-containing protein [Comamonas sp. BIGb0152]MCS4293769.1 putative RNA-binding Zn-ribbon protein involved in translation (DUF1610 family) [Comamonas sp. BIGb0152]
MGHYDIQQVCINGHQITDSFNSSPEFRKNFCASCGSATIHRCPNCDLGIPGCYKVDGIIAIGFSTPVPTHCSGCGKSFPWAALKVKLAGTPSSKALDPLVMVEQVCGRFHLIARQIKARHANRETLVVNDEYDVQDLLHALLHLYFDDIRREEWTPSYAGGSSRVDFLLKSEQIIIEVKKTRATLRARELGDELLIDCQRYKAHPDCKRLFCFVYDPDGWISNPRGLENDLSKKIDDFEVKAVIVPKGY